MKNDAEVIFDALTSFDILKKLAFMTVDEEAADKRIEDYFASKPIKTRTIFENNRIKKQYNTLRRKNVKKKIH
jgi:hypothetical protein